eukprot:g76967.t1
MLMSALISRRYSRLRFVHPNCHGIKGQAKKFATVSSNHRSAWLRDCEEFDYIVVGGGTSGCTLARRLSCQHEIDKISTKSAHELPAPRVLLLEAGQDHSPYHPLVFIPASYLLAIGNSATDWCYSTTSQPGLNGRVISPYARGKGLGGCSLINGMIVMRGQRADFDQHWRNALGDQGGDLWTWDRILPAFMRSEDHFLAYSEQSDSKLHRRGGELPVSEQRLSWPILDDWQAAAASCGIPNVQDFNDGSDRAGCGYFHVSQRQGFRISVKDAMLGERHAGGGWGGGVRPKNLTVWADTQVDSLVLRPVVAGPALSVEGLLATSHGNKQVRARLKPGGELILTAGAIGSPAILQRSGIGPPDVLNRAGVDMLHAANGVGRNLHDHLQIRAVYKIHEGDYRTTLNTMVWSLRGLLQIATQYALHKAGPLSMAPSQLGCFAHSDQTQAQAGGPPDLEWHVQPLSLDKFGSMLHRFPALTTSVCNLRPTSRGSVSIQSSRPKDPPLIDPNYLHTENDRQKAAAALRVNRTIMSALPMAKYRPEEWKPGLAVQSDADLARAAGDIGTTIFHPVGTCKMGRKEDNEAVVDAQLRCYDIAGLRIADASIMPYITSGNTNLPSSESLSKRPGATIQQTRNPTRSVHVPSNTKTFTPVISAKNLAKRNYNSAIFHPVLVIVTLAQPA